MDLGTGLCPVIIDAQSEYKVDLYSSQVQNWQLKMLPCWIQRIHTWSSCQFLSTKPRVFFLAKAFPANQKFSCRASSSLSDDLLHFIFSVLYWW